MATINVLDSTGSTVTLEKPLAPGTAADSASRPVAFSTEGKAQLGSVTETAPGTDTASSGLNGRLQRIAQRLTSLIALLPASVGSKADAASLAVTQSTEDKVVFAATNTKLDTANTQVGIVTETAPGTDTASSGLNGRLQRIAQRITSLIALLPASLGAKAVSASLAVTTKSGGTEYETVAASASDQTLGATGATGDYLERLICVVATAATSQVQIKDGAGSAITVLPDNVGAGIGTYTVELGLTSLAGAWKVTTGAGVSVIAAGDFT